MTLSILDRIKLAMLAHLNVLIWGPPGTGKSYAAYVAAAEIAPPHMIVVPEDCAVAELRGHFIPHGQTWQWHDGPVTAARRNGTPLILDEISHASPEAVTFLHQALDDSPFFTLPNGDTVTKKIAPVLATMNDDPKKLRPALLDRFAVQIHIPRPLDSAYAALKYGDLARAETSTSLRAWVALEKCYHAGIAMEHAAELIFPGRGDELVKAITIAEAPAGTR